MNHSRKRRIEFGDFQTPERLAIDVCERLATMGVSPDIVIEPTCGTGAFVRAAARIFSNAREIIGFEINKDYLNTLQESLSSLPKSNNIRLEQLDFFATDWHTKLERMSGKILVLGNFPWVTNSVQGAIGGENLPEKSNFLKFNGFDAISGKSNFDISEWMLLAVLRWFSGRSGYIAMLAKTAVARKILSHAERQGAAVRDAFIIRIDAKKDFGACVDACLFVVELSANAVNLNHDYTIFDNLQDARGRRVGHRMGLTVGDLDAFERFSFLVGKPPQKWRSGIKHDAAAVMEFTQAEHGLKNGLGELVQIEPSYLFPLLKGSDVGSDRPWREKYTLVTQRYVGEPTNPIKTVAPLTWHYLDQHASVLDTRASIIYAKNPRFSVFGVGDYAFRPWRIAICSLYKKLNFRIVGPVEGKPVMFDDTVYYLSFDSEAEARNTLSRLNSKPALGLLSSLIFWDEKRPIKTAILNVLDWSQIEQLEPVQAA